MVNFVLCLVKKYRDIIFLGLITKVKQKKTLMWYQNSDLMDQMLYYYAALHRISCCDQQ